MGYLYLFPAFLQLTSPVAPFFFGQVLFAEAFFGRLLMITGKLINIVNQAYRIAQYGKIRTCHIMIWPCKFHAARYNQRKVFFVIDKCMTLLFLKQVIYYLIACFANASYGGLFMVKFLSAQQANYLTTIKNPENSYRLFGRASFKRNILTLKSNLIINLQLLTDFSTT